jgi:hypothetical protein
VTTNKIITMKVNKKKCWFMLIGVLIFRQLDSFV